MAAGGFVRLMTADAKARLISHIVASLGQTPRRIEELQNAALLEGRPGLRHGVAKGRGLDIRAVLAKKHASAAD
jgi:hypothetical protein